MNILTVWLQKLYYDCNFKVKYKTVDKESYKAQWELLNSTIHPATSPEFFSKGVDLGNMANELESVYVEINIENAGYKQPHEYFLSSVYKTNQKVFLTFSSEFTNWPVSRIVILDEYNNIIRNDFKKVYEISWKDYKENKYQRKKKTLTSKLI